jgi:hypothetical protein
MRQPDADFPLEHDPLYGGNSIHQRLDKLKTLCNIGWSALGNVMLLIGGDDTVEINFTLKSAPVVDEPVFSSTDLRIR